LSSYGQQGPHQLVPPLSCPAIRHEHNLQQQLPLAFVRALELIDGLPGLLMFALQSLLVGCIITVVPRFETVSPKALQDMLAHPFACEGVG